MNQIRQYEPKWKTYFEVRLTASKQVWSIAALFILSYIIFYLEDRTPLHLSDGSEPTNRYRYSLPTTWCLSLIYHQCIQQPVHFLLLLYHIFCEQRLMHTPIAKKSQWYHNTALWWSIMTIFNSLCECCRTILRSRANALKFRLHAVTAPCKHHLLI